MRINLKKLWPLLQIESESGNSLAMENFLTEALEKLGAKVEADEFGNLCGTKGNCETYPCIVAHLDTVHTIHGDGIAIVKINDCVTGVNPKTMRQTGIGGDDKCGIFAALHCLEHLPACKVAFFRDEEVGCMGSYAASAEWFKDCRFILQADRRGNSDFVTDICGELSSDAFQFDVAPMLEKHGFKPCRGAMSDVMALRDIGTGVSCANMSAGYHNPHSPGEYINLADLDNTCALMLSICESLEGQYPFEASPKTYKWHNYSDTWSTYDELANELRLEPKASEDEWMREQDIASAMFDLGMTRKDAERFVDRQL